MINRPSTNNDSPNLKQIGGWMFSLCLVCMLIGRAIVRVFFPELRTQGFAPTLLVVLIPIWSLGIVGIVLWLIGSIRGAQEKR